MNNLKKCRVRSRELNVSYLTVSAFLLLYFLTPLYLPPPLILSSFLLEALSKVLLSLYNLSNTNEKPELAKLELQRKYMYHRKRETHWQTLTPSALHLITVLFSGGLPLPVLCLQMTALTRQVHILICLNLWNVTLAGKRVFAGVIQFSLSWDHPGCSMRVQWQVSFIRHGRRWEKAAWPLG